MTSENGSRYSTNTEQVLHYLGIPLKASYDIFSRRHFTIYASAGGMVEKCIKGKVSTKSRFNESDTGPLQDKVTIRQLQWSVSAEAGVQWNIIPMLGVYIEPGVSWYFDNGSMVSTIYKEKPLNFNLEFGLGFWTGVKKYAAYDSPVCGLTVESGLKAFILPNDVIIAVSYVF